MVDTFGRIIKKAQLEHPQDGPDMIDLAFQFTSGDTSTPLVATIPAVGLRLDFACRLVSAHVSEMSVPSITGDAEVAFYYRDSSDTAWTDMSDGTNVSMSGAVHGDLDVNDNWFRYLEAGQEVTAMLVNVATCQSLTASLTARKLPVAVSGLVTLMAGGSSLTAGGAMVGIRRG